MGRKSYWEKLQDPRWQRKRLEIMQIADFRCEKCGDKSTTLNVHHRLYRKGADPWDYEDEELQCICKPCHESEHEVRDRLAEAMAVMETYELERVLGYAQGLKVIDGSVGIVVLRNWEHAEGVSDATWLHSPLLVDDLINKRGKEDNGLDGLELSEIADARRRTYSTNEPR